MSTNAVHAKLPGAAGQLDSDLAEPDALARFLRGLRNALFLGVGVWGLIGLAVVRLVA